MGAAMTRERMNFIGGIIGLGLILVLAYLVSTHPNMGDVMR